MINTSKKYTVFILIAMGFLLFSFIIITYVIDPFFHYHEPYDWISYNLDTERYQNNGILKNFRYNAIITGTSMTQNFRASELDKLFNVNTVKTTFSGASYKEIKDELSIALKHNPNIKMIVRCIDTDKILDNYMFMKDFDYPYYLYDELLYNDVNYIFNKSVLFDYTIPTIINSVNKEKSTTFDEYSAWYKRYKFGKEYVLKSYDRIKQRSEITFSDSRKENVYNTINENVISLAKEYPNTEFYVFFPPYSIYYYDGQALRGRLRTVLEAIEYAMSLLVEYDNIHVYSFMNEFDLIQDLNNYKDFLHYSEKINSQMLVWMKEGHDLITKDNYKEYMNQAKKFYLEYDYDKLFDN